MGAGDGGGPDERLPPSRPSRLQCRRMALNPNFGMNMPMMSSAFDTAAWLNAA